MMPSSTFVTDKTEHNHIQTSAYEVMAEMNTTTILSEDNKAHTIEYFMQPVDETDNENTLVLLKSFTEMTEIQYLNEMITQCQADNNNNEGFFDPERVESKHVEIMNGTDYTNLQPLDQFNISAALLARYDGGNEKSGSNCAVPPPTQVSDAASVTESHGGEINPHKDEVCGRGDYNEDEAPILGLEYGNDYNETLNSEEPLTLESLEDGNFTNSSYDQQESPSSGFDTRSQQTVLQAYNYQLYENSNYSRNPYLQPGTGVYLEQQQTHQNSLEQMNLQLPQPPPRQCVQQQVLIPNFYPAFGPMSLLPIVSSGLEVLQTMPIHQVQSFGMTNLGQYPCPQNSFVACSTAMYIDNKIYVFNPGNPPVMAAPQPLITEHPQQQFKPMILYVNAPEFFQSKKCEPVAIDKRETIPGGESNSPSKSEDSKEISIIGSQWSDELDSYESEDSGVSMPSSGDLVGVKDNDTKDMSWIPNPYMNIVGGKLSRKAPNASMANPNLEKLQDFGTTFFYNGEELPFVTNSGMPKIYISKSFPELKYEYYVPPMVYDNDNFGGQQFTWQIQMMQRFYKYLPHVWRIQAVPEFTRYKLDGWIHFSTAAKFRFCCRSCIRPWTSMRGKVMIAFRFDPITQQGTIFMKQFGQVCVQENCTDRNFQTPANYPEEIDQVLTKLSNYVGYIYYGLPLIHPHNKGDSPVRSGNPRSLHLKELCQACFQGVCSRNFG